MTYGELKEDLKYLLAGDSELRGNAEAVRVFYRKAADTILEAAEPLTHISCDLSLHRPFRFLDSVFFLRRAVIPVSDEDEIDMDEGLMGALTYFIAAYMSVERRGDYESRGYMALSSYMAESYNFLADIGFYDYGVEARFPFAGERRDIPLRLMAFGFLKYYTARRTLHGWRYLWDRGMVEALDRFMLTGEGARDTARLFEQYASYLDGEEDGEADALLALDRELLV